MFQSTSVAGAAYDADWTGSSKQMAQCVQIIVSRSQQPLTMKAYWGIVTMDMDTIVTVSINPDVLQQTHTHTIMLLG